MIPHEVIDQIISNDLVSIIEREGFQLKRSGANYQCCCPFHDEKTPSFIVSPRRNTAHCFGSCGTTWNAISFIMDLKRLNFPDAVDYLCGRLGIHYEKRELTAEEREEQFRRDTLIAANNAALEYFCKCYEKSPGAKEYVRKRKWTEEAVNVFSIGYAPSPGGLLQHMTALGWKTDKLLEAGLVKRSDRDGSLYDTFRDRVMFPIHSRNGYICGFTGRYIGEREDMPKYLNTPETELYNKGKLLFGLYESYREISLTDTVILCEGNPDVIRLHQIGQGNAVAPCGTALTDDQIDIIRQRAKKVILIGDTDTAGVKAVLKNGEALLKAGLAVRVMTLPDGKDPDEYFGLNPAAFDECLSRETKDYVVWIADREFRDEDGEKLKLSQTEAAEKIKGIASMMAWVKDEAAVTMYIDTFKREFKGGKVWETAYYKAKNELERKAAKDEDMQEMLRDYGFYVKENCYYGAGAQAKDRRWSNFILVPILHIRDEKNARRIFLIRNSMREESVIKFQQSELVSPTDFKVRTETAGNYVWEAGPESITAIKRYLYREMPSADEIRQLGWQKRYGFYAWGNGGLDDGTFVKADKYGILDIKGKRYYMPGCAADTQDNTSGYQIDRKFVYAVTNDISLHDYAAMLVRSFGDNAKVGLCFLVATLFRDVVTSVTTSFPILNLFGPKGTGKSELGHSLTSFFIPNYTAPNISNTTKAALAEAVAEVSNAVVHLDEYKNSIPVEKLEFLKGLWDGTGRSRINMDNDKKRETTAVDCGVVMSGQEMPTKDIALFNRLVFLSFTKSEFSDREKADYEELKAIEKRGLTHLTCGILKLRNMFVRNFRDSWETAMEDLNGKLRSQTIEDRTLRNWVTVLAAFGAVESELDFPFDYREMLELAASMCLDQHRKTKQNGELSGFWEILDSLVSSSKAWMEVDYKIMLGMDFRVKDGCHGVRIKEGDMPVGLHPDKNYLLINYSRLAMLYAKEGRETDSNIIPKETLRFYLEHSPEFIGTALSIRFKVPDSATGYITGDSRNIKSKITKAMMFDYDLLQENYNLDINVSTGYGPTGPEMPPIPEDPTLGLEDDKDDMPY